MITSDDTTAVVTGAAVTTAKRLQEAAAPGEILIGDATRQLVENAAELEPVDPVQAKGKKKPIEAWRVLSTIEGAAAVRPPARHAARRSHRRARASATYELAEAERGRACRLVTVLRRRGNRQVAARGGARDAGCRPDRRRAAARCLPYGDGITFLPLDGADPVGRRRATRSMATLASEDDGAARRPGAGLLGRSRCAELERRDRSGPSDGCSRRSPVHARSSSASRTCTGPSRRSSTCSSTSPAGAATRRSCCSVSRGPTFSSDRPYWGGAASRSNR